MSRFGIRGRLLGPIDVESLTLPAGLVRRLEDLEAELPLTPAWRAAALAQPVGGPLGGRPVAGPRLATRSGRAVGSAFASVLVAMVVVVAVVVVGQLGPLHRPSAGNDRPSAAGFPGAAPSASGSADAVSPSLTSAPPTSVTGPAPVPRVGVTMIGSVRVVRGAGDARRLLVEELGATCFETVDAGDAVPPAIVDKLARSLKTRTGLLVLPDGRDVYLGPDVISAATARGASILAIGTTGNAWIALGSAPKLLTVELRSARTPSGRIYWYPGDGSVAIPCPSRPPAR